MSKLYIPEGYKTPLPNYELQRAIAFIKDSFQTNLSNALNLRRVSAPCFQYLMAENTYRQRNGRQNRYPDNQPIPFSQIKSPLRTAYAPGYRL